MPDLEELRPLLGQLIRFGLVGALSTMIYDAVYWPLATYVVPPVVAVIIGFSIAVCIGYPLHSRWSFKGHGRRDGAAGRQGRFVTVQLTGMGFNMLCTWLLTGPVFHGPTWWPLIPATFVTPFLTYILNRTWVFA
jgi:putative flippase GtrA